MKLPNSLLAFALTLSFTKSSLPTQDTKPASKPPTAEELLKLTKPGAEHEKLAVHVGKWDVEIKLGAGKAAMTYQGAAESRRSIGGRFLQIEY